MQDGKNMSAPSGCPSKLVSYSMIDMTLQKFISIVSLALGVLYLFRDSSCWTACSIRTGSILAFFPVGSSRCSGFKNLWWIKVCLTYYLLNSISEGCLKRSWYKFFITQFSIPSPFNKYSSFSSAPSLFGG